MAAAAAAAAAAPAHMYESGSVALATGDAFSPHGARTGGLRFATGDATITPDPALAPARPGAMCAAGAIELAAGVACGDAGAQVRVSAGSTTSRSEEAVAGSVVVVAGNATSGQGTGGGIQLQAGSGGRQVSGLCQQVVP